MPTYIYRCPKDNKEEEHNLPYIHEAPKCPECQTKMKRIFHANTIIYNCRGFYSTDNRRK